MRHAVAVRQHRAVRQHHALRARRRCRRCRSGRPAGPGGICSTSARSSGEVARRSAIELGPGWRGAGPAALRRRASHARPAGRGRRPARPRPAPARASAAVETMAARAPELRRICAWSAGSVGGVGRHGDRADRHDGGVGDDEFGPVLADQQHAVARRDAAGAQPGGDGGDAQGEFAPVHRARHRRASGAAWLARPPPLPVSSSMAGRLLHSRRRAAGHHRPPHGCRPTRVPARLVHAHAAGLSPTIVASGARVRAVPDCRERLAMPRWPICVLRDPDPSARHAAPRAARCRGRRRRAAGLGPLRPLSAPEIRALAADLDRAEARGPAFQPRHAGTARRRCRAMRWPPAIADYERIEEVLGRVDDLRPAGLLRRCAGRRRMAASTRPCRSG